jgi:hypothetical protein
MTLIGLLALSGCSTVKIAYKGPDGETFDMISVTHVFSRTEGKSGFAYDWQGVDENGVPFTFNVTTDAEGHVDNTGQVDALRAAVEAAVKGAIAGAGKAVVP